PRRVISTASCSCSTRRPSTRRAPWRCGARCDRRSSQRAGEPPTGGWAMSSGPPTLVIRNGTVLDGTGADPVRGDVAIRDGRIQRIGEIEPGPDELDAAGRYVAPGFIDIHSHSDYTLLVDPRAVSAIHQGVT